jgi:hypothetical protein
MLAKAIKSTWGVQAQDLGHWMKSTKRNGYGETRYMYWHACCLIISDGIEYNPASYNPAAGELVKALSISLDLSIIVQ